jgi:hypothetical protein
VTRLLLVAALLAGCSTGSTVTDSGMPSVLPSVSAEPGVLPTGKSDLPISGVVFSPLDFVPPLRLTVPTGWRSTHRADDAFDLSRPEPSGHAPLVVVAFITPDEQTAAEALKTLSGRVGPGLPVTGTVGGVAAQGFDVVGGTGPLVQSPAGTLALDRVPGQRARILALNLDDVPLLVVIAVPDGTKFQAELPDVDALLAAVVQG